MDKGVNDFWRKWRKADELEKVKLVETLTLPSRILTSDDYKHYAALIINSYLCELETFLIGVKE